MNDEEQRRQQIEFINAAAALLEDALREFREAIERVAIEIALLIEPVIDELCDVAGVAFEEHQRAPRVVQSRDRARITPRFLKDPVVVLGKCYRFRWVA